MPINRDNFSKLTIRRLAERVAYRCSCPKCKNITIGPNQADIAAAVNLGEAAHIHAAAPGGPRYRADMTSAERQAISNGIWLCRVHARLIDSDPISHPAELLNRWKKDAEALAAERLTLPDKVQPPSEETFVSLDLDLLFNGIWLSAANDAWTFKIKNFIIGDEQRLREHADHILHPMRRYIIVESQNLGRLLKDGFEWRIDTDGDYQLTVNVDPAAPQRKLSEIGSDYAHAWDGDLLITDGDFKKISGAALAIQTIERNLGLTIGSLVFNRLAGSLFPLYYQKYEHDLPLLNRLTKVELIRLMTILPYKAEVKGQPELNFIRKINSVNVLEASANIIPIFLSLEWADGTSWSDTIRVARPQPEENEEEFEVPEFMKDLFDDPFQLLEKLTARLTGKEVKIGRSNKTIIGLFTDTLPAIQAEAEKAMTEKIYPLFESHRINYSIDNQSTPFLASADIEMATMRGAVQQIGITVFLYGFKKAGVDAFDIVQDLFIYFDDYRYAIGFSRQQSWMKKLYNAVPDEQDIAALSAQWLGKIVSAINAGISRLEKK